MDRRSEVINEAVAEEIQRGEERKERNRRVTTAAPVPTLAASTSHESRENPIEPDPNLKKRLLMDTASSAPSGSGQQRAKRAAADAVPEADESAALPSAFAANTRRRIAEKSAPVAVTTHEGIDGYLEKAMRMASVEQVEWGTIMELSITGHVLIWARRSHLSGKLSLRKTDGWNLKNHSRLKVARHLREKTHTNMLVVIIRDGDERGNMQYSV